MSKGAKICIEGWNLLEEMTTICKRIERRNNQIASRQATAAVMAQKMWVPNPEVFEKNTRKFEEYCDDTESLVAAVEADFALWAFTIKKAEKNVKASNKYFDEVDKGKHKSKNPEAKNDTLFVLDSSTEKLVNAITVNKASLAALKNNVETVVIV